MRARPDRFICRHTPRRSPYMAASRPPFCRSCTARRWAWAELLSCAALPLVGPFLFTSSANTISSVACREYAFACQRAECSRHFKP